MLASAHQGVAKGDPIYAIYGHVSACPGRHKVRLYLCPVKGNQAHTHPMDVSKHLIHGNVVWSNPTDPREVTECLENVPREQVPREGTNEGIDEESLATKTSSVTDTSIGLCMEGIEESADNKVIGPD